MDQARFEELKRKAEGVEGLTDDEADELGRLYAERAGEPYTNAADLPHPDEAPPDAREQQGEADARERREREAS